MRRRSGAVEPPSGIAGWNGGRHRTPLPDCAARPAAIRSSWAPVEPGEGRLAELVRIEHVPDQRAAGIFVANNLVALERVDNKDIAVRFVTFGRARPAVSRLAEIGLRL